MSLWPFILAGGLMYLNAGVLDNTAMTIAHAAVFVLYGYAWIEHKKAKGKDSDD